MLAVEILLILLGVASLGFGIWVWIDPKTFRKNQLYDDAPGSIPTLWIVAGVPAMGFVFVLLAIFISRGF